MIYTVVEVLAQFVAIAVVAVGLYALEQVRLKRERFRIVRKELDDLR
jgi:hypothetical protein